MGINTKNADTGHVHPCICVCRCYRFILASILMPGRSASQKAASSSSVFCAHRLMRRVVSASASVRPKQSSALEIRPLCAAHADPEETAIPFPDKKFSIVSLLIFGMRRDTICGARSFDCGMLTAMSERIGSSASIAGSLSRRDVMAAISCSKDAL